MLYKNYNQVRISSFRAPVMQTSQRACLTSLGPEYNSVFGPGGALERARQLLVASRFSPRKPLACGQKPLYALATQAAMASKMAVHFHRPRLSLRLAA